MRKKIAVAAFLLLAAVFAAAAADIWVAAGGTGRGKAKDDPMPELWKAVERAERGDVIHVAEGTYNGKAGSGHWIVKVPNLTMVGGYNKDFSERNPFKYLTVLERAKDFRGDWVGLPEAMVAGDADHSDFTLDGFVLDCTSRNAYGNRGLLLKAPTYLGMAVQTNSKNTKIRNCVILNPAGDGIYCTWQGPENEVTNCFVVNTLYSAIETRSNQPGAVVNIKNNTIVYGWFYPSKGGATGVFAGSQGTTIVDSNVIAFMQTEGGEDGFAVKNSFGNADTVMKNNVFFSLTGGYYKYMDQNKQNLIAWKKSDLDDLNDEDYCEDYMLAESGDNREADPGLVPDKDFAGKFANYIASEPGKLNMDAMNEWRRAMGLPLQAEPGKARENYAFAYPRSGIVGLASKIKGVGVQLSGPFAEYASQAAAEKPASYEEVAFDSFKKGNANSKGTNGKAVQFRAGLGDKKTTFELAEAPVSDYYCVMLMLPGATSTSTRDFVYGYILKGSPADKDWIKLEKKKADTWKDGVVIKGKVYDFKNQAYPYPVGVIVDSISNK